MNVDLGFTDNGQLAILSDEAFPGDIKRVEYYRDQRLFMFIYDLADHEGDLIHYEIPEHLTPRIDRSGEMRVLVADGHGGVVSDYLTPLIKIGV